MSSLRWRMVVRDLWLNLGRTMLVILGIAVGVFGVGFSLDAYSILTREIDANLAMTNPASASLWMDSVDTDVVNSARSFPGIAEAEARIATEDQELEILPVRIELLADLVIDGDDRAGQLASLALGPGSVDQAFRDLGVKGVDGLR